jgi:hypothetical protein
MPFSETDVYMDRQGMRAADATQQVSCFRNGAGRDPLVHMCAAVLSAPDDRAGTVQQQYHQPRGQPYMRNAAGRHDEDYLMFMKQM